MSSPLTYDNWKLSTPPGFGEGGDTEGKGMKVGSKKYKAYMKEVDQINERTGWNEYLRELKQRQAKFKKTVMKATNPLKDIMLQAGRDGNITNRSYYVKAVNNVLNSGFVSIKVCALGKVWEGSDGVDYNLKVTAGGWASRLKINHMGATDILRAIGNLLLKPQVKDKIKANVFVADKCQKCNGVGHIPAFHYYCSGICFDCCGTGFDFKNKTSIDIKKQILANI